MMTKLADFYDAFGRMMHPVTHPEDSQNLRWRILIPMSGEMMLLHGILECTKVNRTSGNVFLSNQIVFYCAL